MLKKKPIIGLAGGIGSGKSTVAKIMGEMGGLVIDADGIAKDALRREDVKAKLVAWWGEGILAGDGSVDRGKLAEMVFEDTDERLRLESLIHPIVSDERGRLIEEGNEDECVKWIILDVPLLFEVGLDEKCDLVVFVDTPEDERLERVMGARGWDGEELRRREKNQFDLDKKRNRSGYIIDNSNSGADQLHSEIRRLLDRTS